MLTIAANAGDIGGLALMIVLPLISGILGGVSGAFVTGIWMGRWREETKQNRRDIDRNMVRLAKGDDKLAEVSGLLAITKELRIELQAAGREMQQLKDVFVSRRECDLRHRKRTG